MELVGCGWRGRTTPTGREVNILIKGVILGLARDLAHLPRVNGNFIKLKSGIYTSGQPGSKRARPPPNKSRKENKGPSKGKLLPPRGGWGNWPLWEFFPRQVVEGLRQCQTG